MQQRRIRRCVVMCMAVGALALGAMTLVANSVSAASGNGPYYATPSWDQKLPAGTRFIVLTDWTDEAVLDRETGLVWEKAPLRAELNWDDARRTCTVRRTGTRMGWRIPSVHELASLIDFTVSLPALPFGHPFTVGGLDQYWSGTIFNSSADSVWYADIGSGTVNPVPKTASLRVWCVRGGNSADVN